MYGQGSPEAESAQHESDAEQPPAQQALDAIGDAVLCVDLAGDVTYLNPVAVRMTGWPRSEAIGKALAEVMPILDADTRRSVTNPLLDAMTRNTVVTLQDNCLLVRCDGSESPIEDTAAPMHDPDGQVTGGVIVFRSVGAALAMSQQMSRQALHDVLTGLPNRLLLRDRIEQAIAAARRHHRALAVLYMDLDAFKHVNDSIGHAAGDQVLQSVARRLVAGVRRQDTVCRLGGDEFVVLLSEVSCADDATLGAGKLCAAIAEPLNLEGRVISVTASVGVAVYPSDGRDVDSLLERADQALLRSTPRRRARATP
jgi:diguanylate cyclase (GGDEF)-like protein/PAS domain S-box-containing protein